MSKFLAENTKILDLTIMDDLIDHLDMQEIGLLDLVAIDGIAAQEEERIFLQKEKSHTSSDRSLKRCNSSKILK
jgi:hypothetical protein